MLGLDVSQFPVHTICSTNRARIRSTGLDQHIPSNQRPLHFHQWKNPIAQNRPNLLSPLHANRLPIQSATQMI